MKTSARDYRYPYMVNEGIKAVTVDRAKAEHFLHLCSEGDLEGLQAALHRGYDVNSQDWRGWCGLKEALMKRHIGLAIFLLEQETIDVNFVSHGGTTVLHDVAQAYIQKVEVS